MPPTYTASGATPLIIFIVMLFVMYWFVWRKMTPGRQHRYPRAVNKKLTMKVDRVIINHYLDEHEEKIS